MVHINTTLGSITIQLYMDEAPVTCKNFLRYIKEGFYDGTIFHRVIDNFMIQGGGFLPSLSQKPAHATIENEADNGLRNERGTIAMARTSDPLSASSQFFINVADNDFLNYTAPNPQGWGYCVFGRIAEGIDVVDKIKGVPTTSKMGYKDVPVSDILIDVEHKADQG